MPRFYDGQQDYIPQLNAIDVLYETVRNSYYGAFASAPTTRPGGGAPQDGDRYYDTTVGAERTYNGSTWYIPNVDAVQLASPNGGEGVVVTGRFPGSGSVSVQSVLQDQVRATDRMTPLEVSSVRNREGGFDAGDKVMRAYEDAVAAGAEFVIPGGRYESFDTVRFDRPLSDIRGAGSNSTEFKYSGGGTAIVVDNSYPNNNEYAYSHSLRGITVTGNPNAAGLISLRAMNQPRWSDINLREVNSVSGQAMTVLGVVSGHFSDIVCSSNRQPMASRPANCLVIDRDPTPGKLTRSTNNYFQNVVLEGAIGDGLVAKNCDSTTWDGGTTENHGGNGATLQVECHGFTFRGAHFESNSGFADVYNAGFENALLFCDVARLLYVDSSAINHTSIGGKYMSIQDASSSASFEGLMYNYFDRVGEVGTFQYNQSTKARRIWNAKTNSFLYIPYASYAVVGPAGGPEYTYTNNSGVPEHVIVRGGTITQLVFMRNGAAVETLNAAGQYFLAPGDGLKFSYTVFPSVVRLPFNGY